MRRPFVRLLLLWAALPSCGGCLVMYTGEEAIRPAEPKRQVLFESPAAARTFAETVQPRLCNRESYARRIEVPILASVEVKQKLSEAAFYNDELAACDTNGDGFITEAEAEAYRRRCAGEAPPCADASVLVQEGYVYLTGSQGPYEVHYARPYAGAPDLTFPGVSSEKGAVPIVFLPKGVTVDRGRLEESPTGFRLYLTGDGGSGMLHWEARGAPTAEAPAAAVLALPRLVAPGPR
jgi:hypothetical protein